MLLGCLAFVLFLPFFLLYGTWAWAVVIKSTWLWFICPAFSQPPLTFAQAVAMSVFFGIFAVRVIPTKDTKKNEDGSIDWQPFYHSIWVAITLPWVVWCLNWIIKTIFM